jgi:hypothetical protein
MSALTAILPPCPQCTSASGRFRATNALAVGSSKSLIPDAIDATANTFKLSRNIQLICKVGCLDQPGARARSAGIAEATDRWTRIDWRPFWRGILSGTPPLNRSFCIAVAICADAAICYLLFAATQKLWLASRHTSTITHSAHSTGFSLHWLSTAHDRETCSLLLHLLQEILHAVKCLAGPMLHALEGRS